jgi:transcriptional regulator with XRE-family HTH domain
MKQLAAHCGVTFQQIHKYEAGKVAISAGMLWALAEALSIGVGDLFPNTPPALADSSVAPQDPLPVDLRRARATRRGD